MRTPTRTTITPGDRVTVLIQHSGRPMLRPLIGRLRTVEVTADRRVILYDDDGRRSRFDGRTIPPVALVEASVFTDPATGELWAETYQLSPRDPSPYPLPPSYAAVAEPDGHGGITRMPTCRCGHGCACPTCGLRTTLVGHGLEWMDLVPDGRAHSGQSCGSLSCPAAEPVDCPDCCALPMRLAPVGWVCRRDTAHRRPYRWPAQADDHARQEVGPAGHPAAHGQEAGRV